MVKKFLSSTKDIFGFQNTSILAASTIIMTTVAASRILGLVRDRMLTARFTADELGVYFAAFRLPNLIFELIVMGALTSAFIPVFTQYLAHEKRKEAFAIASSIINIGIVTFALLSVLVLLFTKQVASFIAPGFSERELSTLIIFTRIMVIGQVFPLIIGNFLTGILQSYKNFTIPALAPVAYNIGIIIGIGVLTPMFGLYGPVYGVIIGAFLFFLILIPGIIVTGYRYQPVIYLKDPGVREIGKLMVPRTAGLAVAQIDSTVDLILSSLLGARSVTIFNLAQHLLQVPVGLFGASIAQAALPTLAELQARKNYEEFKKIFLSTFHQIVFLTLPATVLLIVLRIPIVRLVFGASRFDWPATVLTGKSLAFFALSLSAQAVINLLARTFYALHDTKTPVIVGSVSVGINVLLSIIFIYVIALPVWGLALSASIATLFNAGILFLLLQRSVSTFNWGNMFIPSLKMISASFLMGISLYIPMKLLDQVVFDTTKTFNLLLLTGIASITGMVVYIFLTWFLKVDEVRSFFRLAQRVMNVRQTILETPREVIESETGKIA